MATDVDEQFEKLMEINFHPMDYPAMVLSEGPLSHVAPDFDWNDKDYSQPNEVLSVFLLVGLPALFLISCVLFTEVHWVWVVMLPVALLMALGSMLVGLVYWLDPAGVRDLAIEVVEFVYGSAVRLRQEIEQAVPKWRAKRGSRD